MLRLFVRPRALIVDVLPKEEYEELHVAGAVNLPLKELPAGAIQLDRRRPIVVSCHDFV